MVKAGGGERKRKIDVHAFQVIPGVARIGLDLICPLGSSIAGGYRVR